MEASPSHRWRARALFLVVAAVTLTLLATALLLVRSGPPGSGRGPAAAQPVAGEPSALGATRLRLATFNLLGAGHTRPGGDTRGFASGEQRMVYSVQILRNQGIDLVGFQEMREVQYAKFVSLTGGTWGTYPGQTIGERAGANNIAWRKDTWTFISGKTIKIPYLDNEVPMPYVELANVLTGQRIFVGNFHNPSDKYGNESRDRREAVTRQIALVDRLRAENPGVPVYFTGDFNERASLFCRFARNTELRAANGGYIGADGSCHPPALPMPVDWLFGTAPGTFSDYLRLRDSLVQKATDHPVVIANSSLPPVLAQLNKADHVVVVAVDGLRSGAIQKLGAEALPGFHALMSRGSSALNARTTVESTLSLPNILSMLTGTTVSTGTGGHGVGGTGAGVASVHKSAGRYVPSVFDVVHDRGLSTAVFAATHELDLVDRSWGSTYGASDTTWVDNGRDKISSYTVEESPQDLLGALTTKLSTAPASFTFAQLNRADLVGHRFGFSSERYLTALKRLDWQVRKILGTVQSSPVLRGNTLVVVTGTHGGVGTSHSDPRLASNYLVPMFVLGPGVAVGGQLYAMNPDYASPGMTRPGYTGTQPIRNTFVANLVLGALALPATRGSSQDYWQNLTIYAPPEVVAAP